MEISASSHEIELFPFSSDHGLRTSQSRLPAHILLGKLLLSVSSGNTAKVKAVKDFFNLGQAEEEMLKKLSVDYPRIWIDISEKLFKAEISLSGQIEIVDIDIMLLYSANGSHFLASNADIISLTNPRTSLSDWESERVSTFCPRSIESSVMQRRGFPKFSERLSECVPVGAVAVEHSHKTADNDKTCNKEEKVVFRD